MEEIIFLNPYFIDEKTGIRNLRSKSNLNVQTLRPVLFSKQRSLVTIICVWSQTFVDTSHSKSLSSVQFSHSLVSDSSRPHEPQHARPPYPSPTSGVYPNSCPLSWWCYLTISFSVIPSSSCLQSFPTTGSFQMSQLFASGGQNTGVSASISVLPMNTQNRFPLGWTGWKSLNFYSNLQSNSPNTMRT